MRPPAWLVVVLVGAAIGLTFAGISTYDFVQHLDRQVHSLHCSFIPGGGHNDPNSGCQVAMMSPYSSVMRSHVWGGIPISLPAMAVFAFIGFFAVDLVLTRRKHDVRATLFLVAASTLPLLASLVMLTISLTKLGAVCKLCACIYISSGLVFAGALGTWRRAVREGSVGQSKSGSQLLEVGVETAAATNGFLGAMFGLGVVFVIVPVLLYLAMAPDNSKFIGTCDALPKPEDTYGVMINSARSSGGAPTLEILDPLCPACKAFEERLEQAGLTSKLDRRAILFPLDSSCNWMITETVHPGACTVSEAVLCAGDRAPEVIKWAFEVQDQIRADAKTDPTAAARYVKAKFPDLAACVGSPEARSRLNKSLRWSVANNIHVLTPQLFVDNVKLCDEDVDLGLEFALGAMLDRHAKGTLIPPATATPAKPAEPPHDETTVPKRHSTEDGPKKPAEDKPAEDKPVDKPTEDKKPAEDKKPVEDKPADKPADKPVTTPEGSAGGAP